TSQWTRDPLGDQYPQHNGEYNSDEQRDQHPSDDLVAEGGGVGSQLQQHDSAHPGGTSLDEHLLVDHGLLSRDRTAPQQLADVGAGDASPSQGAGPDQLSVGGHRYGLHFECLKDSASPLL